MRRDLHVEFGKGRLRLTSVVYFHHYTPNIELAFNSVEYIMRDGAGTSVLAMLFGLTRFARVFKILLVKPSMSIEQVFYDYHSVLH